MPVLENVGFLVGLDYISEFYQILVNSHLEIRLPVIPLHIERLTGDSNQLVQRFPEPIELPTHGLISWGPGRRIAPLGLGGDVHQNLVVLGVRSGV